MGSPFDRRTAVIESILDGYERQSVSAMLEHVTGDVEWLPLMSVAEGRAFKSPEGVARWFGELMQTFDEVTASVEGERIDAAGH
jgi:hypothetical protein